MKAETKIVQLFTNSNPLLLESGESFKRVQAAYQTYGKLNSSGDNAILLCHALTGNAHAAGFIEEEEQDEQSSPDLLNLYSKLYRNKAGWWDALIGEDKLFDTTKYFVVCSNFLGSCYGTTGPVSKSPENGKTFQADFPLITVRDMVTVQKKLIDRLGIKKLKTVIGGSLGGMQVIEWALMYPDIVQTIIPIATAVQHSPWAISLNQASREAIKNDAQYNKGFYSAQPEEGLALARRIAMISYRSHESFQKKFSRDRKLEHNELNTENIFQIENYLNHHGKKLTERFDANTYITITNAMDNHDVTRGRAVLKEVLASIGMPVLSIGISSDILYPPSEQKEFAALLPNAMYEEIKSMHGHDAFLIEFDQLKKIIGKFSSKYF